MIPQKRSPDWDELYRIAAAQDGHFTTAQAAEAGYSPQLLAKYLRNGRVQRIRRGIYRLVHFPAGDHEDLTVLWLWTDRAGVFSLETALSLHELSDALPSKVTMTLPESWKRRRLRVPRNVVLYYSEIRASERTWHGAAPVTTPARTVRDCAEAHVPPDIILQAIRDARHRGLFAERDAQVVREFLATFGDEEP